MPELLLELGMEELPASFVERAFQQLRAEIVARLNEEGIAAGEAEAIGTPRRLIVRVKDVAEIQPDRSSEVRGPALKAAYDEAGNPTKALEGFCRGQGVPLDSVSRDDTYVWATKRILGRLTRDVLPDLLESSIRALSFDKSMRWGVNRMRFARPIRWILATYAGEAISFTVETVTSGVQSRGHRFNFPDSFEAKSWDDLLRELRSRQVEPDPEIRRQRILDGAVQSATGQPDLTESLVDENTFLTEWPEALEGEFKPEYLVLPEPVLVTAMAKHERFFPVRDSGGKITNRFISIRNGGNEATVRAGNAWVLNARFNDAKFFFDEDANYTMDDFLARTERMLFQEKLGTVRERAHQLSALAGELGNGSEDAMKAGLYMKADLSTGLVSELASLQGIIGGEYCRREGWSDDIAHALSVQYAPERAKSDVARAIIAADHLDKLAGYLGLGLAPSGSSDPYGLRRAATILIELAWNWHATTSWLNSFQSALAKYSNVTLDSAKAEAALCDIFSGRYKALLPEARYDLLDAAMLDSEPAELLNPNAVKFRLQVLQLAAQDETLVQAATRPLNIVAAAKSKGISIPGLRIQDLESPAGLALSEAANQFQVHPDAELFAKEIRAMVAPINAFFDSTMVMVEEPRVRDARLGLLEVVGQRLLLAGDWTKVVLE